MADKILDIYNSLPNNHNDKSIFILDYKTAKAKSIILNSNNIYDGFQLDNITLNYYWIEYDYVNGEASKKITCYYKDVDWEHRNVHVIPGIVQKWSKERNDSMDVYDNGVIHKSKTAKSTDCRLFSEYGWYPAEWEPKNYTDGCAKIETIEDYAEMKEDFVESISGFRENVKRVGKKDLTSKITRGGNPSAERYSIMRWINIEGGRYTINFYKIVDVQGFGPCAIFGCVAYEKTDESNKNSASPNVYYKTEKGEGLILGYDRVTQDENLEKSIWYMKDIENPMLVIDGLKEYYKKYRSII